MMTEKQEKTKQEQITPQDLMIKQFTCLHCAQFKFSFLGFLLNDIGLKCDVCGLIQYIPLANSLLIDRPKTKPTKSKPEYTG